MANGRTFKVRNKETGEVITVREKSKQTPLQKTEQKISQRKDILGPALQEAGQQIQEPQISGGGIGGKEILGILGGLIQRGEAAVANPAMETIRRPEETGVGLAKTLLDPRTLLRGGLEPKIVKQATPLAREVKEAVTGETLAERGDIFRALGVPEKVSATLGFVTDPLILKSFFGTGSKSIAKTSIKQADNLIDDALPKIIKTPAGATGTAGKAAKQATKGREAIKTIVDMKDRLQLQTNNNEIVSKLPETLDEFSQAVAQTKKILMDEAITPAIKASTKAGARVDISGASNILDDIIKDPAIKFTNPDMIAYAQSAKERLLQTPNSPKVINDIITNLNANLQSFYKSPVGDPTITKRLAVDALVANKLRPALDKAVSEITDTSLAIPKLKYGALRSIEEAVRKQANKLATKTVGIIDYSNIFSIPNLVSGFATANSGAVARGATQFSLAQLAKGLLNPNRAVRNMFSKVDKLTTLSPSILKQLGIKTAATKTPASGLLLKELMKSR